MGRLGPTMPGCVCPNIKNMGSLLLQVCEMNKKISLKMGLKFAASVNMGENVA